MVFVFTLEDIPLPASVLRNMVDKVRKARGDTTKEGKEDVRVCEVELGHGAPFMKPEVLGPKILDVLGKEFGEREASEASGA